MSTHTPAYRAWQVELSKIIAAFCEFCFRTTEMIFVTGAVRLIEIKSNSPEIASTSLVFLAATYCRTKTVTGVLPVLDRYDFSEGTRTVLRHGVTVMAITIFFAINTLLNRVVPLIVAYTK
jgi:hypothetical protein